MDPKPAGTGNGAQDPELAELSQDVAPEPVIEKMEAHKQAKVRREETDQV
jgi:hypothetical protein